MEEEYEETYETNDTDAFSNVAQGLSGEHKAALVGYWQQAIDNIERIGEDGSAVTAFKSTALPLARIKKVMKTDSEVCMISAEAPILFAKGCDIFITELTMRAWIHAEESKRRTLQRSDIANALQKSDMFDFLIDIVPREEAHTRRYAPPSAVPSSGPPQSDLSGPGPSTAVPDVQQQVHDMPLTSQSLPHDMVAGVAAPGAPDSLSPAAGAPGVDLQSHAQPGMPGIQNASANTQVAVEGGDPTTDPAGRSSHPNLSAGAQPLDEKCLPAEGDGKLENGANFDEEFQYQYNDGNTVYSSVDVGFREF